MWIRDFFKLIQLIMPDGIMRSIVLALENYCQFHLDRIASTVANSTLRTDRNDKPVIFFGSTLFDSAHDIFANIPRQPLVNRRNFRTETLQLVDRHRTNFE